MDDSTGMADSQIELSAVDSEPPSDEDEQILITDVDTLMHRQINPSPQWIQNGVPSSLAFRPSSKDGDCLSVDNGNIHTAQQAYLCFTSQGYSSAGTWSLTVGECHAAGVSVHASPVLSNQAHCCIDFAGKGAKSVAKKLKRKAVARGRQYP